jgi:hypothetical protein
MEDVLFARMHFDANAESAIFRNVFDFIAINFGKDAFARNKDGKERVALRRLISRRPLAACFESYPKLNTIAKPNCKRGSMAYILQAISVT